MKAQDRTIRDRRLYEASLTGNVDSLNKLIEEDELILARACLSCFDDTPLHIAATLGHTCFAREVVKHKPDLAAELNSQGFSPLHIASTNGYLEIVKVLISLNPNVCLVRNEDGRTPLHLAVMKGRTEVVKELIQAKPEVIDQYKVESGETVLHLAVKHNRIAPLKLLLDHYGDEVVNVRDDYGNTILHLATSLKQIETIKYLLSRTSMEVNAVNRSGFTAFDVIESMPQDLKAVVIQGYLAKSGALKARNIPKSVENSNQVTEESEISEVAPTLEVSTQQLLPKTKEKDSPTRLLATTKEKDSHTASKSSKKKKHKKKDENWVDKKRNSLMVTASVMAAMAYQAALTPPGGLWDDPDKANSTNFKPGTSIMDHTNSSAYVLFCMSNSITLTSSLSIIFLLVSGLTLRKRIFFYILKVAEWMTAPSMAISYLVAIISTCSSEECNAPAQSFLILWMFLVFVVLLVFIIRLTIKIVREIAKFVRKMYSKCKSQRQK